jgi:hypothetical protein
LTGFDRASTNGIITNVSMTIMPGASPGWAIRNLQRQIERPLRRRFVLGVALMLANQFQPLSAQADAPQPAPQPWQYREAAYFQTIVKVRKGDPEAQRDFDQTLTEFEKRPMSRTPMENMDILGTFYIPKEGFEKALPIVAMNAVLGWYDALRYGSNSGRAEIINNRRFFLRPIAFSGKERSQEAINFLTTNPKRAQTLIEQGIGFAEKYKDAPTYDHRWPSAFGLERMIDGLGGKSTTVPLPIEKWPAAWEESKQRVRSFYFVANAQPGNSGHSERPSQTARVHLVCPPEVRAQSMADKILFNDMLYAAGGVGMLDEARFPDAQERSVVKIEVIVPYNNQNVGQEQWTIRHSEGSATTYLLRFIPDGSGGTNFTIGIGK